MKNRFNTFLLFAISALLLFACGKTVPENGQPVPEDPPVQEKKPLPGEYYLPLIETTDIHGYIISSDKSGIHYRLAYVADKVRDIRGRNSGYGKDKLLLLDGGDLYQGCSVSNLLSGSPIYISMDKMEYDAVALGNHEFDWHAENMVDPDGTLPDYEWDGQPCVNEVPLVCSNLYKDGAKVPWTRDYVIVDKTATGPDGRSVPVRIGIVGFAVNYAGSIMTSKFTGQGYSIKEDFSIANGIAASLESSGQCDATVLLIHGVADNAAKMLGQDSVIDMVLGGHSHQTISGWTSWGLPYLQGGRYCEHYGYAELEFTVGDSSTVSFKGVNNLKVLDVDASRDIHTTAAQNAADLQEDILAVSDNAIAAVSRQLNEVVGYIDVDATGRYISGSGNRATVISNWMCDILRRIGEADVSFVNSGGVRTSFPLDGKSRRNITVSNVYELFPFDNATYVYSITYADLLDLLEYAMTGSGQSLFSYMTGIDCYFSGYEVTSLRKDGTVIYQNNRWTGDWASRTLILSVSEYLATTQRVDSYTGSGNPLLEWNNSSRLLYNNLIDNENAVLVLQAEAAASGGHLYIDSAPHFIQSY